MALPSNIPLAAGAIRVGIADDDPVMRFTVAHALNYFPEFRIAAVVEDGAAAVRAAEAGQVDVFVLDLNMPVMDGREALRQIRACAPAVRVVIYSSEPTATYADDLKSLGASAYVEKGGNPRILANIILRVVSGG